MRKLRVHTAVKSFIAMTGRELVDRVAGIIITCDERADVATNTSREPHLIVSNKLGEIE